MSDSQLINVWQGERKLIPNNNESCLYQLRCLTGVGYIRNMSISNRIHFARGDSMIITGSEIITLSGKEKMTVELKIFEER